jgi:hypothetical protein
MLQVRGCAPTPSPSNVFTFGLTIDSIKELGGASIGVFKTIPNPIFSKVNVPPNDLITPMIFSATLKNNNKVLMESIWMQGIQLWYD